jgi:hypothetical protein
VHVSSPPDPCPLPLLLHPFPPHTLRLGLALLIPYAPTVHVSTYSTCVKANRVVPGLCDCPLTCAASAWCLVVVVQSPPRSLLFFRWPACCLCWCWGVCPCCRPPSCLSAPTGRPTPHTGTTIHTYLQMSNMHHDAGCVRRADVRCCLSSLCVAMLGCDQVCVWRCLWTWRECWTQPGTSTHLDTF